MKQPFSLLPKIAVLSIAAAFAAPAMAQTAGSNIVNLGWFHLSTQDSSETLRVNSPSAFAGPFAGSGASVSNADTLGLAFTHFFTDNFAVTTDVGIPPTFKLTGTGTLAGVGEVGRAKQWSPAVIAKWYFGEGNSQFRPFVGVGVSHVWYSSVELSNQFQRTLSNKFAGVPGAKSTADLSSSWAPVLNVGAVYNFDKNWSLGFSVAYIPLKTKADITTTLPNSVQVKSSTSLTLDPIVTFLSLGYKF